MIPLDAQNVEATVTLLRKPPRAETSSEWETHWEIQSLLSLVMRPQAKGSVPLRREPRANQSIVIAPMTNDALTRRLWTPSYWNLEMGGFARSMPDLGSNEEVRVGPDDDHQYSPRCGGRFNPIEDRSPNP